MTNSQRDISTDVIRKTVDEIQSRQRPPSAPDWPPALPCKDHDSRLMRLERENEDIRAICKDHDERLHNGDLGFLDMRKDIQSLAKAVNDAVEQMKKASEAAAHFDWGTEMKRALVNWGVPVAILMGIWLAVNSGAVPVTRHADKPATHQGQSP